MKKLHHIFSWTFIVTKQWIYIVFIWKLLPKNIIFFLQWICCNDVISNVVNHDAVCLLSIFILNKGQLEWFLRKSREGHNFFAFFKCNGIYCAFQSVIEGDEDSWIDFSQKVSNHYWSMETCQPSMSMFKSKDFTSTKLHDTTIKSYKFTKRKWNWRSYF